MKKVLLALLVFAGLASQQLRAQGPCDPQVVDQLVQELIAQGSDCLGNAGPFTCVNEVFDYAFANCPPVIDTTWYDPCQADQVDQLVQDLISQGFDCLNDAGPFACVNDVFDFAFVNCPPVIDTTGYDPCQADQVDQLVQDLISQGFDCLNDAGPFACVNDVFDYAFENCAPPIDTTGGNDCDPAAVAAVTSDLIAQGYTCLEGAGPFSCVHDVVCYAFDNCPQPLDTFNVELPACLLEIPSDIVTFQQFIAYIADNCGSDVTSGIPSCWLTAPAFDTDEEFFAWILENCEGVDSLVSQSDNALVRAFYTGSTLASRNPNQISGVTVSPNPTSGATEIRLNDGNVSRFELFEASGRLVMKLDNVANNRVQVDMSNLPSGIYQARIFDEANRLAIRKLVKQ